MDICWNTIRVAFMVSIFLVPETLFASSERSVTAHTFSFISIEGEPLPLSRYAGKSVLIVNGGDKLVHGSGGISPAAGGVKLCHL